jgi:hypothetical protein
MLVLCRAKMCWINTHTEETEAVFFLFCFCSHVALLGLIWLSIKKIFYTFSDITSFLRSSHTENVDIMSTSCSEVVL